MFRWRGALAPLSLLIVLAAACGGGERTPETGATDEPPPLPPDVTDMTPTVALETSKGRIVLELDRGRAPVTVANFLEHVEAGFYDGLIFHRVIPGFMIQGGGFNPEMGQRRTPRDPIENEAAESGLRNARGSIAMARTGDPHSATSQFFINVVDNASLDHRSETPQGWGYAVFGRVTEGMDVVDSIAAVSTTTRGPHENVPVEPVVIERARVVDADGSNEDG